MDKLTKEFGMTFERGTDIGFHMDEIKQNSTEDLLVLRSSIYSYLKTKKLKKRNSKYMDVYIRINKELTLRSEEKENSNSPNASSSTESTNRTSSFSAQSLYEFFDLQKKKEKDEELLNKKIKNSSKIDIPNFLNDKNLEIKKKKEVIKEKEEKISNKFDNNLKENNYFSDFGRGLFNEKFDLDLSEDEPFVIKSHKNSLDNNNYEKELEIREAFFDPIPEEAFLCLD